MHFNFLDFASRLTKMAVSGIFVKYCSGGCSSAVESQIVDLVVAGSNPVIHPVGLALKRK